MDEKKPTPKKKSTSSSTGTKRTYTKKATVPAEAKSSPIAEEKSKGIVAEPVVALEPPKPKESIGKVFNKQEKVMFMFPFEQGYSDDEQVWERSFNGVIYRFKRGVPKLVPIAVKEYVERQIEIEKASRRKQAAYQQGAGKKLNFS